MNIESMRVRSYPSFKVDDAELPAPARERLLAMEGAQLMLQQAERWDAAGPARGHSDSFASNIARPGSHPQTLHQDSGAIHPIQIQTPHAPILVNTVYIMQDVNELRQQENWQLAIDPEVLRGASDKLLQRMGYFSSGLIEIGSYCGPKTTVGVRLAMESGDYTRIRHLASPVPADVRDRLTIHRMKRRIDAARAARGAP